MMLLSYLKITLRSLVRHKLYTLINILGLAVGIGFCVLVMLFIRDEHSYDDFHVNGDRIYRVMTDSRRPGGAIDADAFQPMPLIPALLAEVPGIRQGTRFNRGEVIVRAGNNVFEEDAVFADRAVLSIFTLPTVNGDAANATLGANDVVLSETMARKYFGTADAVGKRLAIDIRGTKDDFLVTGVLRDVPENSSLRIEILLPIVRHGMYERAKDRWTSANGSAWVELEPGTDPVALAGRLGPFVKTHHQEMLKLLREHGDIGPGDDAYVLRFQPISGVHLDATAGYSPEERSDPAYSWILGAIGLFVLLIACINFTTLAIARSASRSREVGVRKVLGAVRLQLIKQFWGEALLLCFTALIAGMVLAELSLPAFNEVTGKKLSLDYFSGAWLIAAMTGLLALVGLVAGSYPAIFLSRFQPAQVLKGTFRFSGRTPITRALIVLQFTLSIVLIVSTMVMSEQIRYILTKDLGFQAEQLAVLELYGGKEHLGGQRLEQLRVRAASIPGITGVTGTNAAFTHGFDVNGFTYHGQEKSAWMYMVDADFLDVLGIALKEGKNFNPADPGEAKTSVIVNEALVRDFGMGDQAVGQRIDGWQKESIPGGPVVIGVTKNFNFGPLRDDIRPAVLYMNPEWGGGIAQALIRIAPGQIPATVEKLRGFWADVSPDKPFTLTFLNEDMQKQYEREERWMQILQSSSVLAIVLACMGLFGLAGLSVVNRTKEIGIRKVLGASVPGIAAMLSKEFALLVIISNALALPVAFYLASRWLESYAFRMPLGPWAFLAGGLGALALALGTVAFHAVRAGRTNPVNALRYE